MKGRQKKRAFAFVLGRIKERGAAAVVTQRSDFFD